MKNLHAAVEFKGFGFVFFFLSFFVVFNNYMHTCMGLAVGLELTVRGFYYPVP
jgi:Na+-transporting methylmalonyl-CoA/oxaloacetate decarboxylase gamma subunit